jgi:FSR family fosmidomycin resistance protein-like MFS transporter
MLTALMLISGVIAQPLGGTLSDKIGRKRIFILTMLLLTVSLAGFAISKGIVSLIFLPLIGVGIFSTFPVAFIYASELVGFERSGASIGFMYGASQLIASTSPLFMGYVIDNWGFTASFYLLIFFAGLAFIASIAIRK